MKSSSMSESEYRFICGLDSVDVGSKRQILKEVLKDAKKKKKKLSGYRRLRKNQLRAIYYRDCFDDRLSA